MLLGIGVAAALAVGNALARSIPPLPAALEATSAEGWQRWGSGDMRWLGFELYRATLWVAASDDAWTRAPHALVLQYRRSIPAHRLVATSLDEMERLGASAEQLRRWEPELKRVFRDVAEGDSLTGIHRPGHGASFFFGGTPTGEVLDQEFAQSFFAIWLDENTREPKLRDALLTKPATANRG